MSAPDAPMDAQTPAPSEGPGGRGPPADAPPASATPSAIVSQASALIWAVALLAALAALSSRALEPALPGVWVGVDHVIAAVKLGSALASQLFAVLSWAVVLGLTLATVRSSLPAYLRAYAVGAAVLVILAVMVAMLRKLPDGSTLVMGSTAALLALLSTRLAARYRNLRAASLCIGLSALGGAFRVVSILLANVTMATASTVSLMGARVAATLASLIELSMLLVALGWLIVRPPSARAKRPRVRWIALGVVLAGAGALLFLAARGRRHDIDGFEVLVYRAIDQLLTHPEPYWPWMMRGFAESLAWWLTGATLVMMPRTRLMSAAVALALVSRTTLEIPLCAVALVIAALAIVHHPGPDLREELAREPSERRVG